MGIGAFLNCTGLTSLALPNSITIIGKSSFKNCSGIKTLTLSNSLTSLSESSFLNCSGITSVILPDTITTLSGSSAAVGEGCFQNCTNLKKILIPNSVVSIDKGVFSGCKNLTIYGSKNSVAQDHATKQQIKFDYIENWDKADSGNDISAPTVKSIQVTSPSSGTYNTPQTVKIRVYFSESIVGETIPTLKIKFGTGTERSITNGTIKNDYIEYSYNIQAGDNGQLTCVSLTGGTIKDASGNEAKLSCPLISGNTIKANTEGTTNNNTDNQDKNNNTNKDDNTNNKNDDKVDNKNDNSNINNNNNSNNNSGNSSKDATVAGGKIPQTGATITSALVIIAIIGISIIAFKKYNNLRDII